MRLVPPSSFPLPFLFTASVLHQVAEVEEKRTVIDKCTQTLTKLQEFNDALSKAVNHGKDLEDWAGPTNKKLKEITTSPDMSPEDRVKEILILQEQSKERLPQIAPLDEEYKKLLTGKESNRIISSGSQHFCYEM